MVLLLLFLQVGILRLTAVKVTAQGHMSIKKERQELKPGLTYSFYKNISHQII